MKRRKFIKLSMLASGLALVCSYPIWIERSMVRVNRYRIIVDNLPEPFHGFTIAQLTDLHLGALVTSSFIEGVVKRTNELNADMIVCTGDYVHDRNTRNEIDRVWPILSKLNAKHGVHSVLGNHDHWADTERSLYWLDKTKQNIRHQCKVINKEGARLVVGGAGDLWEDQLNIDQAFADSDEHDCKILLAHNPDSIDTNFKTPVSLTISGHTHGGQVVLPFVGAPIVPVKNKRYTSGLILTEKCPLFISRGIGWSILPVRFNCYPEIAILELARRKVTA